MPRSSNSKKRPQEVGKTSAGIPAWPKTSSSMSRPSAGESHLWYSRFIAFPSATLMQSYFTGAVAIALEPFIPSSFKTVFGPSERKLVSADSSRDENREHNADKLDSNPRYSVWKFHSEILPDDRMISVYLPPQYLEQEQRRFPVFYLQDGQNLFDGRTSYIAGRTWNAHKTADRLTQEGEIEPVILVGVANTGLRRMAEYTPTRDFKMGGGEGYSYGRLLIEELKPMIDSTYRTLPGPHNTGLGGSSLGGLLSLYLGFEFPQTFGKLAVMS